MNVDIVTGRRATVQLIGALVLAAHLAGCTTLYTADVGDTPTQLPATHRSATTVALVLDDGFVGYHGQFNSAAEDYPIGSALRNYATNAVENRFEHVTVYTTLADATKKAGIILIPKVVDMQQQWGGGFGSKLDLTITISWSVKDASGARTLGTVTVIGEGEVDQGNVLNMGSRMGEVAGAMLDDLSKNTQYSFSHTQPVDSL